jgi:hypothetical protein
MVGQAGVRRNQFRRWMTAEDEWQALQDLKAWAADHPDRTPQQAVRALGLPDMTGVPADPNLRDRTQRRMAYEATAMLSYAEYALNRARRSRPTG